MQRTNCRTGQGKLEKCRANRASMRFGTMSLLAVSVVAIGCAGRSQVILVPDPPPVMSDMALVQLDVLKAVPVGADRGCLATGDPLAEYLHETEDYFDYVDTLRGEGPEVSDAPWWMFWD